MIKIHAIRRPVVLLLVVVLGRSATLGLAAEAFTPPAPTARADIAVPASRDSITIESLPDIGLWMLSSKGDIASWLGWRYNGRELREPINVIIVDLVSKSETEAIARLEAACAKAGFEERVGHSSGYSAIIGDSTHAQLPRANEKAFSDGPFEIANNHGRIFGPAPWMHGYVFTAAFSREFTDIVAKVKHHYRSFNQARDAFTQSLDVRTPYRIEGFLRLGNTVVGSSEITTGDHDGMAVFLVSRR